MRYTFRESDLREVFEQFGVVAEVELSISDECAYVTMSEFFEAW